MMAKCFIATLCVLAAGAGSLLILVRGNNNIFCVRGISDAEVVSSHDHTLAFQKLFKKKPKPTIFSLLLAMLMCISKVSAVIKQHIF